MRTTSSGARGQVAIASVVDAINEVEDPKVRQQVIAVLRERLPQVCWLTNRDSRLFGTK